MPPIDQILSERFKCTKCRAEGAISQRFAATGTGFSMLFDIQYKQFISLSGRNCGYTGIYDPRILEQSRNLGTVLDVLFG
jgi:uncharacterized protein